jgi:hypothetical protein
MKRTNLPRAQAIGEKLKVLQGKSKHGEWQTKLKTHCPKVSYETATLYIRLWDKRDKLKELAAAKSVTVTDLTIQEARKLLATLKPDDGKGATSKVPKGGVEPGNEPKSVSMPPDKIVAELEYGELFDILKVVYDRDDRMNLTTKLAADLGMKLVPVTPPVNAPSSGIALERRI